MKRVTISPKAALLATGLALTACTAIDDPDDVPDFIVQHVLSALTSKESFSWDAPSGRSFLLRPLGTFKNGDVFCRDFEISQTGIPAVPARRTACRVDDRWVRVDPSTLS